MELSSKIKAMKAGFGGHQRGLLGHKTYPLCVQFMRRKDDKEARRVQETTVQEQLGTKGHWQVSTPAAGESTAVRLKYFSFPYPALHGRPQVQGRVRDRCQ